MTCIAAVAEGGLVWMGGDGRSTSGWDIYQQRQPKVFRVGDLVAGSSGSRRMHQLVQRGLAEGLERHEDGASTFDYLVACVVPVIRRCLADGGCLKTIDGVAEFEGAVLIGCRGGLYVVSSDFSVSDIDRDMMAIGAGSDYALGALYATRESGVHPMDRLRTALAAAATFNASVGPPYAFITPGNDVACVSCG
jgi:ATP-dependent protease HslVU (ClpYQ) peptidase subunit